VTPVAFPAGTRILYADDAEINRFAVRDVLNAAGCSIDLATDGAEAASMACGEPYDLILLDLRMPGTDGFEGARRIRAKCGGAQPLVALTASTGAAERKLAAECGFDLFLAKPIDSGDLVAALAGLLANGVALPLAAPAAARPAIPPGLEHLLPLFLAEMGRDTCRLLELAADGDRAALADHAHAMRGKCAMFGEDAMFALLADIECRAPTLSCAEIDSLCAMINGRAFQLGVHDKGI
jgi:CheY-like chemotaxis protein/HPt (histidine-containing phosphotransfer) domain-containing protein